jgi:hypothetical protein
MNMDKIDTDRLSAAMLVYTYFALHGIKVRPKFNLEFEHFHVSCARSRDAADAFLRRMEPEEDCVHIVIVQFDDDE